MKSAQRSSERVRDACLAVAHSQWRIERRACLSQRRQQVVGMNARRITIGSTFVVRADFESIATAVEEWRGTLARKATKRGIVQKVIAQFIPRRNL